MAQVAAPYLDLLPLKNGEKESRRAEISARAACSFMPNFRHAGVHAEPCSAMMAGTHDTSAGTPIVAVGQGLRRDDGRSGYGQAAFAGRATLDYTSSAEGQGLPLLLTVTACLQLVRSLVTSCRRPASCRLAPIEVDVSSNSAA